MTPHPEENLAADRLSSPPSRSPGAAAPGRADPAAAPGRARAPDRFEVTAEGSLQAARRLHDTGTGTGTGAGTGAGRIAVLNFASARNPGGGYLGGARAQEEDLCRHSLLYPCLLRAPEYYEAHRASRDLLYSDRVIWSPDVPVHRGNDGELLPAPYPVSFLTCPAPNTGEALRRDPAVADRIPAVLRARARRVLSVAAHHGARRLVLGAWGCGVFRNDPRQVAEAFHAHLAAGGDYADVFDHVVFAVWDRNPEPANRAAFTAYFAAETGTARPA
ncbi:TIGR02452 family protein [Actinoallomurus rhizosphaericola]|uniref:TIGR02452 family protein n=1 Tax=Actinoallomurus rhizosphaericola TaxID=2952536 RepID=UPI00209398FE|nr:TIGR02452 family protein [Actinoallomurus rhizosphaericola]MCO5997039.1 TIGR02452 family protein [Actinoallomurus rhizosphaericola]